MKETELLKKYQKMYGEYTFNSIVWRIKNPNEEILELERKAEILK